MASQGANSPSVVNNMYDGDTEIVDESNITSSDNSYAYGGSRVPRYVGHLEIKTFGFSIPTGATIDGIVIEIERKALSNTIGGVWDNDLFIIKADGSYGSTNKADTVNSWETADTVKSYGSSSDKWGETWTAEDINDADFGCYFNFLVEGRLDPLYNNVGYIDHVRCTVYYTEAVSYTLKTRNGLARALIKTINGLAIASLKERNGLT